MFTYNNVNYCSMVELAGAVISEYSNYDGNQGWMLCIDKDSHNVVISNCDGSHPDFVCIPCKYDEDINNPDVDGWVVEAAIESLANSIDRKINGSIC